MKERNPVLIPGPVRSPVCMYGAHGTRLFGAAGFEGGQCHVTAYVLPW